MQLIALGSKVRDRISGLVGTVTGRAEYLFGCVQVLVSPAEVKDGAPVLGSWLDEGRVEAVVTEAPMPRPESAAVRAGGPVDNLPPAR